MIVTDRDVMMLSGIFQDCKSSLLQPLPAVKLSSTSCTAQQLGFAHPGQAVHSYQDKATVDGCCVLYCRRARGGQTEGTKDQENGLLIALAHQSNFLGRIETKVVLAWGAKICSRIQHLTD